ncbi:hypothetical protein [uncultured Porphyromonas sp.]|jgi:hypothetical protein|uniref:hypothetical protein n=1 Tax=uncultured Porphyromonas sp. TaxID=159274 RepID=UPI00258EEA1B|nr:hypothetical protein [uncultured Porphyromonas sp.]
MNENNKYMTALEHATSSYPDEYARYLSEHNLRSGEASAELFLQEYEGENMDNEILIV